MAEQAPLVATPDAPVPPGGEAEWFSGAGGARLRGAVFTPEETPRGTVVLSGGRTEPIEKYFEVICELMDRGFVVVAHDWRGQGLSLRELPDRLKGHADGYQAFLTDFTALIGHFRQRMPKPWVAMGHSMGGCLTLLALAHGEARNFAGAKLSAPMLGIRYPMPPAMVNALVGFNRLIGQSGAYLLGDPGKPFDDTFEGNVLTHDEGRFKRMRAQIAANPDLALGGATWGWMDFALRAMGYIAVPSNLAVVRIPVVICSAEEDSLVDNAAHAVAVRNLPDGRQVMFPGSRHEILMETDAVRARFWTEFDALAGQVAPAAVKKAARRAAAK